MKALATNTERPGFNSQNPQGGREKLIGAGYPDLHTTILSVQNKQTYVIIVSNKTGLKGNTAYQPWRGDKRQSALAHVTHT